MGVLTEEEKAALDNVATSQVEATAMLLKFQTLRKLVALAEVNYKDHDLRKVFSTMQLPPHCKYNHVLHRAVVEIGCPHCETAYGNQFKHPTYAGCHEEYACGPCAYNKPGECERMVCTHYTFGGISYSEHGLSAFIGLTRTSASVCAYVVWDALIFKPLYTWIEGHIEWAERVLKKGGTNGGKESPQG